MKDVYISALGKISLSEVEKDKAKALYAMSGTSSGREENMRTGRLIKPAVILVAGLALVVAVNVVVSMYRSGGNEAGHRKTAEKTDIEDYIDNYFSVTAYAKELTKTGKVYPEDYSVQGFNIGGRIGESISFACIFPVECKGKNIDTITYACKEGVFGIVGPQKDSIVVGGEKVKEELNVPGFMPEGVKKMQDEQYKSFTVKYDRQSNEKTKICIADTSDAWSAEKKKRFHKSGYDYDKISADGKVDRAACNFLVENLGITCTVTYQDGSTETKNIKVSCDAVKYGDVWENIPKEDQDDEMIVTCFSMG